MVMRQGRVVEEGAAQDVIANPQNAYTRALFAAAFAVEADQAGVVSQ
jgi:microcin C transport system ATP-binding protein